MMSQFIMGSQVKGSYIYFGSYTKESRHPWYSAGANKKIIQTLGILESTGKPVYFFNICPGASCQPITNTYLITSSLNPIVFYWQIMLEPFYFRNKKITLDNPTIFFYNSRFYTLLFFLSFFFFISPAKVVLQLEDMPTARTENNGIRGILDIFSTSILKRVASHIFYASNSMYLAGSNSLNRAKSSIYPPALDNSFIQAVTRRNEPFTTTKTIFMYAGSLNPEKGIYELLEAFDRLNLDAIELRVYGGMSNQLMTKYSKSRNICFMGVVPATELRQAYANADVIVNPHRKISNNSLIFPCKNIEILGSGALPLFSRYSTVGLPLLDLLPLDCIFDDEKGLVEVLENSENIWQSNRETFINITSRIHRDYAYTEISDRFRKLLPA